MSHLQKPAMKAEEVVAISTRNAVLRAWSTDQTQHIKPDPALCAAIIAEVEPLVQGWHEAAKAHEESSRRHRIQMQRIAELLGADAHNVGLDGQPTREVLYDRLADLVAARIDPAPVDAAPATPKAPPREYPTMQQMIVSRETIRQQQEGGF